MQNFEHKTILLDTITDLLTKIDNTPCHPKNKLLLYHRFVLSKISWHFTIADLSKTWVVENLDNIVGKYVRGWFELPISATLSTLIISKSNYGLNLVLPSTKFIQCQTIIRNALKSSNSDIFTLYGMIQIPLLTSNMINTETPSKFSNLFKAITTIVLQMT